MTIIDTRPRIWGVSTQLVAVIDATGCSRRQAQYWRTKGWLHTPSEGPGSRYPWLAELPQLDWLARLNRSADARNSATVNQHGAYRQPGLDDEDAEAGYRLRALGYPYAIRVGRDPWRGVADTDRLVSLITRMRRPFTVAVVVRPEIAALDTEPVA